MKTWIVMIVGAAAGSAAGVFFGKDLAIALLPEPGAHGAWYASRAAGVASYLFIWLGLVGGLLMSSAWFDGLIHRGRLLAIHQVASIAGMALGLFHGLVLIPDGWTQFGYWDILVPFGSYYQPLLSAVGTLTLYLGVIVSASFWFRSHMGAKAWRMLHYSSFLVYAGALWHGINIGTDASTPWLLGIYVTTSLTITFGLVIRVTYRRPSRKKATATPIRTAAAAESSGTPASA